MWQGFRKIDPDRWEFANEGFLRGQKPLLTHINRRKSSHAHNQSQSIHHNASFTSCVEMGKFWLDEDIGRLKRDKNILMQELLRLRQQQQTTDTLLRALTKYTQKMEQHQQQMLSFLSKAIQNPELLAQLVQQKSSNNQIPGGNKKRRYPIQKEFEREITSSDGQIINYQRALLTDAAKSTLMQILNSDKSDSFSKPECVAQHGNFHLSTDSINNSRIPSGRSSGISLENPPRSSGMSNIPASSGISTIYSSSVISEIQSSLNMSDPGKKISVSQAIDFQECAQLRCILADERIVDIPSISHLGSEEINPFEMENFSGDAEFDIFMAEEDIKLPAVVDSFWENFL